MLKQAFPFHAYSESRKCLSFICPYKAGLWVNRCIRNKYRNKQWKKTVETVRQISAGLVPLADFWVLQKAGVILGDQFLPRLSHPVQRTLFLRIHTVHIVHNFEICMSKKVIPSLLVIISHGEKTFKTKGRKFQISYYICGGKRACLIRVKKYFLHPFLAFERNQAAIKKYLPFKKDNEHFD